MFVQEQIHRVNYYLVIVRILSQILFEEIYPEELFY